MGSGILIIEEKQETLERMQNILTERLYVVFTTRDVREGMDLARDLGPDLILLNADIRHGQGLTMAKELKGSDETKDIPIILLTTPYKTREFIEEGVELGADGFIFVPFDEIDFLTKVYVGLRIKSYIDSVHEKEREVEKAETEKNDMLSRVSDYEEEIDRLKQELSDERVTDELTGVYNRREFLNRLEIMVNECIRFEEPIVLFLYDIDHLKIIEDEFGREVAERVLIAFTEIVKKHSRTEDIVARFGDDEFIVAYKRMRYDFIDPISKRLKSEIEDKEIIHSDIGVKFSACLGISCNVYSRNHRYEGQEEAVHEALVALRNAKRRGTGEIFVHPLVRKM